MTCDVVIPDKVNLVLMGSQSICCLEYGRLQRERLQFILGSSRAFPKLQLSYPSLNLGFHTRVSLVTFGASIRKGFYMSTSLLALVMAKYFALLDVCYGLG